MICVCIVTCSRKHDIAALTYDDRSLGRERLHALVGKMLKDLGDEGKLPQGRCPICAAREFSSRLEVTPFDTPWQAAECIAAVRNALHEISTVLMGQRQRHQSLH